MWAWGDNGVSALGDGSTIPFSPVPVQVSGESTICVSREPVQVRGLSDVTAMASFGTGGYAVSAADRG